MRALMWLAYLAGLHRGDLLRLTRFQVQASGLAVTERKIGERLLIEWRVALRRVVQEALGASPDGRLFPLMQSAVDNAWGRVKWAWAVQGKERFVLRTCARSTRQTWELGEGARRPSSGTAVVDSTSGTV